MAIKCVMVEFINLPRYLSRENNKYHILHILNVYTLFSKPKEVRWSGEVYLSIVKAYTNRNPRKCCSEL